MLSYKNAVTLNRAAHNKKNDGSGIMFLRQQDITLGKDIMKKPDLLVILTLVVALGATITSMSAEQRPASVIASESSIR